MRVDCPTCPLISLSAAATQASQGLPGDSSQGVISTHDGGDTSCQVGGWLCVGAERKQTLEMFLIGSSQAPASSKSPGFMIINKEQDLNQTRAMKILKLGP